MSVLEAFGLFAICAAVGFVARLALDRYLERRR